MALTLDTHMESKDILYKYDEILSEYRILKYSRNNVSIHYTQINHSGWFVSSLSAEIIDSIKICAIRVSFNEDDLVSTTGVETFVRIRGD